MDSNHFNSTYSPYPQGSQPTLAPQSHAPPNSNSSHNVAPYGSLNAQGHQHSPQQPSSSHPTLPPLQAQNNGGYSFGALSYQQPGSQSQTPTTPHNNSLGPNGQSIYGQGPMLPPSPFNNPYPMSQSMMYPPPSATALPPSNSMGGLPTIRPMPPGGNPSGTNGLPGLGGHVGQMAAHQSTFMQNEDAPTHVVGQQGRRGILPSAPGRPNPPAQGAAGTKSMIPQKDADGKYPCPHCNKTYLHAKHLKRHLLRHTGDRPYMCPLCKDTFSRSDILKRHFQKCSLRRGNPTGANHLSHQRRNTNSSNRLSLTNQEGPIGLANLPEVAGQSAYGSTNSPNVSGDMSTRTSRANSLITPGALNQRNNLAGLGILGQHPANGNPNASSGAGYQQGINAYAMQHPPPDGAHLPPNYAFDGTPPSNGSMYPHSDSPQQTSFSERTNSRYNSHLSTNNPDTNISGNADPAHAQWNNGPYGRPGGGDDNDHNVNSRNMTEDYQAGVHDLEALTDPRLR